MNNTTTARQFNQTLRRWLQQRGYKCSVQIINSYKFPHCWVRAIPAEGGFSNELRLAIFDAQGLNRAHLKNENDVCYGNIQESIISAYVEAWVKVMEGEYA